MNAVLLGRSHTNTQTFSTFIKTNETYFQNSFINHIHFSVSLNPNLTNLRNRCMGITTKYSNIPVILIVLDVQKRNDYKSSTEEENYLKRHLYPYISTNSIFCKLQFRGFFHFYYFFYVFALIAVQIQL